MLNHNAKGREWEWSSPFTMNNRAQPIPFLLMRLYRVGMSDKREGSQTVREFTLW